jgi:hypothetical protein
MRTSRWQLGRFLTLGLIAAGVALSPTLARAEFDMKVELAPGNSKAFKLERTGPARDFVQRVAVYLRYVPVKGNRVHPAFINTHNYLTCEGKPDKKWYVEGVSRVDYDKAGGIAVYGFFFSKPDCDLPTFTMEAITAEPDPA